MKKYPTCSLLIPTYNWPAALANTLESALNQSVLPNEIIICDDGSRQETADLIRKYQDVSPVPIVHVWQPDTGFQLGKIRNKGVAASNYDYMLQIDGDIILHKHYIKDQLSVATPGKFFCGNRYYLSKELTEKLLANPKQKLDIPLVIKKNAWSRIYLPFLIKTFSKYYHFKYEYYSAHGHSMSIWKEDFIAVNGYDEDYVTWGWEDTDLVVRLIKANVSLQFIRLGGIQYHLYHKESGSKSTNHERFLQNREKPEFRCENGVSKYL